MLIIMSVKIQEIFQKWSNLQDNEKSIRNTRHAIQTDVCKILHIWQLKTEVTRHFSITHTDVDSTDMEREHSQSTKLVVHIGIWSRMWQINAETWWCLRRASLVRGFKQNWQTYSREKLTQTTTTSPQFDINITTVCPEKKETKMFFVISSIKLGRF